MRTWNPALLGRFKDNQISLIDEMTIGGTVNKTIILLILVLITSAWTWHLFYNTSSWNREEVIIPYLLIGSIGGLVIGFVVIFKQEWSPVLAPVYALLEGLAIGSISAIFEKEFPGIVIQAVALTFGTLFCLLLVYKTGLIKVTKTFTLGVVAAMGAIILIYLIDIGLLFFGMRLPFIHDSGWVGIGFSLFVVTIAALTLVLDFELIRRGAENGAPKYMEWYSAFALIVTLLWLYLEMLKLLAQARSS
jgi:uncharacterized YccA/Bax inhibitor family protein